MDLWLSEEWLRGAVSWLDAQLAAAGIERTGEVTRPHVRPWGTVLMAPTDRGPVWLKAPGRETVFEVELYQLLHRVAPRSVLTPIAADVERGWILLPDGGEPLGKRLGGAELTEALLTVLPRYGQLQRDLAAHVGDLLAMGVADMRATIMPQRFDEALEAAGRYVDTTGDPADRETLGRLAGERDTVVALSERLAGAMIPASLDHNDLHPWNVFLTGPDRVCFYDWGDSVVAHPFASMLVALGSQDADDLSTLRDAYLEVWSDLAPHAELVEELELACRVAIVARSLTWARAVRAQGYAGEFADAPLRWLAKLL